jgi:outer membrane murein-binding lipoprotein Lpp
MPSSGRGRPPKNPEDRVPHAYSFRLGDSENEKMQLQIRRSGLTESEYIRRAVVRNETTVIGDASGQHKKRAVRISKPANPDARRLLFLIAQISNNCNQMAHAINTARMTASGINNKLVEKFATDLEQIKNIAKELI